MNFFDVTWAWDGTSKPPKTKMFTCINYDSGVFFRINTNPWHRPCISLEKAQHPFLDHDSYLECSPLEVDEFVIEESLRRFGIIGQIATKLARPARVALGQNVRLRPAYIDEIAAFFPDH